MTFPNLPDFRPALLACLLVIVTGCGGGKPEESALPVRPVKMLELQPGGLATRLELPGQVLPNQQANLAFEVPGQMIEVLVKEADRVEAGQVLARLDPRDYEASRDAAEAQLEVARLEAERARALFEREATSKQRRDLAVSQFKVAQAAFDRAEKAYQDTFLKAPISGSVARILADDIANVQAKEPILIVQDTTRLKVRVNAPESIGALARPGLSTQERSAQTRTEVFLSFFPDRGYPAELEEISLMADSVTRTYEITFAFDPPEEVVVLPGMTARVVVDIPRRESLGAAAFPVPAQVVFADPSGQASVWVVDADSMTVQRQSVQTGTVADGQIEILSDALQPGDRVITSGVQLLEEGMPVRPFQT